MKFRLLAATGVLCLLVAAIPNVGEAAYPPFEFKLIYWPTSNTVSSSVGSGNWNTGFIGGDLRWTSSSSWGIHLKYDTGGQSSWGGILAGTSSGTDTVWSGDYFYAWQLPLVTLRGFVGYGETQSNFTVTPFPQATFTSQGVRVGADTAIPIPNSSFQVNASFAYYPSNSTRFSVGGTTFNSSASAYDWSVGLQYNGQAGWLIEGGYRQLNVNTGSVFPGVCPCTANWGGPFIDAGYRW
jgi:hypothetical protein